MISKSNSRLVLFWVLAFCFSVGFFAFNQNYATLAESPPDWMTAQDEQKPNPEAAKNTTYNLEITVTEEGQKVVNVTNLNLAEGDTIMNLIRRISNVTDEEVTAFNENMPAWYENIPQKDLYQALKAEDAVGNEIKALYKKLETPNLSAEDRNDFNINLEDKRQQWNQLHESAVKLLFKYGYAHEHE